MARAQRQKVRDAAVERPWQLAVQACLDELDVDRDTGLTAREVERRRERYGRNKLRRAARKSGWEILLDQFKSIIMALLAAATILSFAFGNVIDGVAIIVVIVITVAIGFFTEWSGRRSMEKLRQLGTTETVVRRGGSAQSVGAEALVPGDVLVVEEGDVITADARLIEANKLQVNEASLTGESVPVAKEVAALPADVALPERSNMLFKGTAVTRGSGEAVVVATGMATELGAISSLVEEAEEEVTPLEERLDQLGRKLVWVVIGLAIVIVAAGLLAGKETFRVVETAVALAVAAVPEGLPIVATVALARGMWRMANHNALVKQLTAVETLGSTTVIFTDKTGTLTEEQMTVTQIRLADTAVAISGEGLSTEGEFQRDSESIDPHANNVLSRSLEVGVLCNNASLGGADGGECDPVGTPLEVALLVVGAKAGLRRSALLDDYPEKREVAFDPDTKMMATFHADSDGLRVAVKGSPEAVLDVCTRMATADGVRTLDDAAREEWLRRNDEMASDGLRMIALAAKDAASTDANPYADLTFLALFGLLDPPRAAVAESIAACHDAGVRTIMVTGDQQDTARNVGRAVGLIANGSGADVVVHGSELQEVQSLSDAERKRLLQAEVFARVTPEQKLNLIDIHQRSGAVVAMTGDGVNDAPALQKADIGVAMGQRGTDVAKEAADVVLQDDAFSSIVVAIEYGRIIFENIRKFTVYLISGNVGEIVAVAAAALTALPLPLLPLQILYLNVLNDVFPSLALGLGGSLPGVMEQPPRDPEEPILTRRHWLTLVAYGAVIGVTVLGALVLAQRVLGVNERTAVTISFLTVAFSRLWHIFNMRSARGELLRNEVTRNPFVWGALALCTGLLLLAVYWTPFANLLKLSDPGLQGWLLIGGMSLVPLAIGQIAKELGFGQL